MKINKIWLENFRSFTEPQSILIKRMPPGLYHVAGLNEVEPSLGANGAGKSSLFESLFWCLFGKTSRNIKAGNVVNWAASSASVQILTDRGWIKRTQSPNSLRIGGDVADDKEVDQVELEKFLGIDADEFLYSFYFSQFSPSFVDLSPAARMEIYSRVMKLERWEEKSDQARFLRGEYEKEVAQMEQKVARAEASVEAFEQSQKDLEERSSAWQEEHIESLGLAEKKIEKATKKLKALQKGVQEYLEELKELVKASKHANAQLGNALEKAEGLKKHYRAAELRLERASTELENANAVWSRFVDVARKPTCVTCAQGIDKRHALKHRRKLEAVAEACQQKQRVALRAFEEVADDLKNCQSALSGYKEEADKADAAMRQLKNTAEKNEIYIIAAEQEEADAKQDLKRLAAKRDPYGTERAVLAARVKKAKADLQIVNKELGGVRFMASAFEFWQKGFKDIRFQLIEESLRQLNAEVNECLVALGLEAWQLEFSVEKETKKGTVRRGFNCDVLNPAVVTGAVPWEVWSGGESQRLRLAAQLGVANMISARTGFDCNLELWDEPTTWLGEEGIKDLLAVLEERAKRYGRVILIADHRSIDFPFAGTVLVTKTGAGSTLSW